MLSLDDRLEAIFSHVWALLPPIKHKAILEGVGLDDLGSRHGSYGVDTAMISLNYRLLNGEHLSEIPLFDIEGNSPAKRFPCISRISHTLIHELWHAIGAGTGLDRTPEWLAISGWVHAPDNPVGSGRYWERRPGWESGPSDWRYAVTGQTFFCREYSSKTPFEDFADSATHITLGWDDFLARSGQQKLAYLRRHLWGEHGLAAVQAARQRWQQKCHTIS